MRQISVKEEKEYKEELEKYLLGHYDCKLKNATTEQVFRALAGVINNKLYELREQQNAETENNKKPFVELGARTNFYKNFKVGGY